ncbi:bifunctional 4-hydroxy-2-oxoglutarate aldolase/2-dehydro-3-deoxy-phosphogluconate aldolase [Ginsengibacter hankyongi]|uniref:Bifunctional 4-hydroxy-2-oxoglutarate aldolase/2-dehydro-3-deoxy-phosphogluconate aldolase n=1 Tax=Ginsengibacter hankyongi TaxID=2607284 RepID=A0A5J5IG69_9BACT|nr:bifunctional 4-hydroxy-2-oxoglutarate aldolase/2-dehydro-3-deoxy-phosphogluconate aldolase [Ginsengibacter hankyongi]KAA9038070.1 bifunctional 4-hydroxy-2-oxoglutarate aldolase/2-dehydro-3-deoxy-phosphogluconate aldolase [Ginsengibacter hankyongi]
MDTKNELLKLIPEQGVLPLYFYKDTEVSIQVLKSLYSAGIRAVEYTNRGEAALLNFKKMREVCDAELKGMYLGIGTIKNGNMAQTFIDAGADYIICPGLIEEVATVADKNNMLWVPGCMTPSEIIRAENMGAKMIKLFPGNILGPGFMSAIKELFPGLLFMPTGGVDLDKENIAGWFKAGVCAVGMGSKLVSKNLLEQKDYSKIEALTKQVIDIVKSVR